MPWCNIKIHPSAGLQKLGKRTPPRQKRLSLGRVFIRSQRREKIAPITSVCRGRASCGCSVQVCLAFDGFAVSDAVATGGCEVGVTIQL